MRKRNRQNEREKNKKAKLAEEEQEGSASAVEESVPQTVQVTPGSLTAGYVRVPQVSIVRYVSVRHTLIRNRLR